MTKTILSQLIKDEKQARDLSYRQIALEAGVSHQTIVAVVNGRDMDLSTAVALCEWLGVSLNVLAPHLEGETKVDLYFLVRSVPGLPEKLVELTNCYTSGMMSRGELQDFLMFIDLFIGKSIRKGKTRQEK